MSAPQPSEYEKQALRANMAMLADEVQQSWEDIRQRKHALRKQKQAEELRESIRKLTAELVISRRQLEAHPHDDEELEQPLAGPSEDIVEEQSPQSTPSLLMEKPSKGKKRAVLADEPWEPREHPSISDIRPKPRRRLAKPLNEHDPDLYFRRNLRIQPQLAPPSSPIESDNEAVPEKRLYSETGEEDQVDDIAEVGPSKKKARMSTEAPCARCVCFKHIFQFVNGGFRCQEKGLQCKWPDTRGVSCQQCRSVKKSCRVDGKLPARKSDGKVLYARARSPSEQVEKPVTEGVDEGGNSGIEMLEKILGFMKEDSKRNAEENIIIIEALQTCVSGLIKQQLLLSTIRDELAALKKSRSENDE
jgi:hypothetical protein